MKEETYPVKGMTCGHCVAAVTEEVSALPGVERAEVSLEDATVRIVSLAPIASHDVERAVERAGYALGARF